MAKNSDEQQIRDVIATWLQATAKGETDTVLGLMANDVVFLTCGNPPMRGRKAFAATMREATKDARVEGKSTVREITIVGDYAFCWSYLTITVKPKDRTQRAKREGNVLSVFRKERNGHWVMWRDANLLDG